jgi:sortase (surface protein transpeptidase)
VLVVGFAIGVVLLALGLDRLSEPAPPPAPSATGASPELEPGHPNFPRARVADRDAAPPRRLGIPAIGVSAPVIPLGLNPDGTLEVPGAWEQTGWYTGGPEPGERGPAVIAGHVDSTSGPAVFYRLGELRRGSLVSIRRADGTTVRFRVRGLERWPKDDFPTSRVYGPTRDAELRLITCGGSFDSGTGHYRDNTIVYASRVSARGS